MVLVSVEGCNGNGVLLAGVFSSERLECVEGTAEWFSFGGRATLWEKPTEDQGGGDPGGLATTGLYVMRQWVWGAAAWYPHELAFGMVD